MKAVTDDIARGQLKIIQLVDLDARMSQLVMSGAYLADYHFGTQGGG
jgi:hypothetical protein